MSAIAADTQERSKAIKARRAVLAVLLLTPLAAGTWMLFHGSGLSSILDWVPGINPRTLPGVGERRISAELFYVLALKQDQRLYGWGWGTTYHGRLGPDIGRDSVPAPTVLKSGVENWRYVAAGWNMSYAITADGILLRLPVGALLPQTGELPSHQPIFRHIAWMKVREALGMTMGLAADGRLYLWRENELAEGKVCLGNNVGCIPLTHGTLVHKTDAELDALEADYQRKLEGELGAQYEQVLNYFKQQPGGESSPRAQQALTELQASHAKQRESVAAALGKSRREHIAARQMPVPPLVSPRAGWMDFCIAGRLDSLERWGGDGHWAYALDQAGALWRINFDSEAWFFYKEPKLRLTQLPAGTPFQRVYCSSYSSSVMAMDADRRIWSFDPSNSLGLSPEQRGLKEDIPENPIQKISNRRWSMVAPGSGFAVGLAADGSLWAWGGGYDEAIHGESGAAEEPILVDDEQEWVEVDTAGGYMVARTAQGQLFTWGTNQRGVLGDGGVALYRDRPRPVVEPHN